MRFLTMLTAIACAALPFLSHARELTPGQAWERALSQTTPAVPAATIKTLASSGEPTLTYTARSTDGRAAVYLFTPAAGTGFVCVAANDAAPRAVLGYSTGSVSSAEGTVPPPMKEWLDMYAAQIGALAADDGSSSTALTDSTDSRSNIEPLVSSTWGQLSPFNDLVPMLGTGRAPAGCVALTMAQCMYREKWPAKGTGSNVYDWYNNGVTERLSLDFDTIPFEWDLMLDHYEQTEGATAEQRAAVARLLYALGVSVDMQYESSGSSSSIVEASKALIKYFDYAETVCYRERAYYELEEWQTLLYDELSAGRPVPYAGVNSDGGHAFVCDGYQKGGYFHFNWGWYGSHDGYFLLTAMNPGSDSGIYEKGYNRNQSMITGLTPAYKSVAMVDDIYISGDFETDAERYLRTPEGAVTFKGEFGIYSQSYVATPVILGARLTDAAGTTVYVSTDSTIELKEFILVREYKIAMNQFPTSGTYTLTPAYQATDGTWHDIRAKLSDVRNLNVTFTSKSIIFSDSPDAPVITVESMNLESPLFLGKEFALEATLSNSGGEFYEDVRVALLDTAGTAVVAVSPVQEVDLPAGETQRFEWVGVLSAVSGHTLTVGKYLIGLVHLVDYKYTLLSSTMPVEMQSPSEAPCIYTVEPIEIDGNPTTLDTPAVITGPSTVTMTVDCTQGYFGERVSLQVMEADHNIVHQETDVRYVSAQPDRPSTVSYEADFSALPGDQIYRVLPYGKTSGLLDSEPAYIKIGTTGMVSIYVPEVKLWPNPAVDIVNIRAAEPVEAIEVYSVGGTRCAVAVETDSTEARLDVGQLTPGMYLVTVRTAGTARTLRLIIRGGVH